MNTMKWLAVTSILFSWTVHLVGGFAPSIHVQKPSTEPPPTTQDPETIPYFLHRVNSSKVTINKGKTAVLECQVFRLRDRTVSWVRRRGNDIHLLTVGSTTYHENDRYTLEFMEPNNWQLVIHATEEADQGSYECQVSSHPPKIRRVFLAVFVPRLEIYDVRGDAIQEKFYEVGSGIDLRCSGYHVHQESITWSRGGVRINHSPDSGVRLESSLEDNEPVVWLRVEEADVSDSGNYTCSSADTEPATVRIQVLDGESSAAMQHSTNDAENQQSSFQAITSFIFFFVTFSIFSLP